jgi:hypothetical protein
MKVLIALAVFLAPVLFALGATAQAKPAPLEQQSISASLEASAIYSGPSGAMLEQDYFRAPQPLLTAGRIFPCRLQLRVFEKTRLAQSCN